MRKEKNMFFEYLDSINSEKYNKDDIKNIIDKAEIIKKKRRNLYIMICSIIILCIFNFGIYYNIISTKTNNINDSNIIANEKNDEEINILYVAMNKTNLGDIEAIDILLLEKKEQYIEEKQPVSVYNAEIIGTGEKIEIICYWGIFESKDIMYIDEIDSDYKYTCLISNLYSNISCIPNEGEKIEGIIINNGNKYVLLEII